MFWIAVCDDEREVLAETEKMIGEYRRTEISLDTYSSGEDLLASGRSYDIILLDIDMQGIDGIETARQIRSRDKRVKLIYVTNYSDYTIFAFAVHAFAYLLKPLEKEELFAQLDEAAAYSEREAEEELKFHAQEGVIRLKPSQILYFEYQNRRVLLHTEDKVWHLKKRICETALEMEKYHFAMPHKSFVVNLHAVQSIRGYEIILTDNSSIPLSQKKSAGFRRSLNQYLAEEGGVR